MRIPYLGLLALGSSQNPDQHVIELEKQVIEQLEKELDQNSNHNANPCPDGNFRCRDGTCIDGKAHCDGISDCPDESDESDCKSQQRLLHKSSKNDNQQQNSNKQQQSRVRRQEGDYFFEFNDLTTALPFFDFTDDTSGDFNFGDFEPGTTEMSFDIFGPGTTANSLGFQFTTEPLSLIDATTNAIFDNFQTTEASFDINVATTEGMLDAFPTTQPIEFGGFGTTEAVFDLGTTAPTFDLDLATTMALPEQTTEPIDFALGTTESFGLGDLGIQTTEPSLILETTEAVMPLIQTTESLFDDFDLPSTAPFVFEPFSTTEMNLFPDVTTEGMDLFPEFTTAALSPAPTTGFPDFPDLVTTPAPTPFPTAQATTQMDIIVPEMTTETSEEDYFRCVSGFVEVVRVSFVCDGMMDCSDGSDEENCGFPEPPTVTPQVTQAPQVTTAPSIPQDTTAGSFITLGTNQPPTLLPITEDNQQYERFIEQFSKWRDTIFDKWLSLMKKYQSKSGFRLKEEQTCRQYGRSSCDNMSLTCKQDLSGCQYCYCEISRSDDYKLVENEWKMDVQFWQDVLQEQWNTVWERYADAEDDTF